MGACPICGGAAIVSAELGSIGREWFCPDCGPFHLSGEAAELLDRHDLQPHHRRELGRHVASQQTGSRPVPLSSSYLQGELSRMGVRRLH